MTVVDTAQYPQRLRCDEVSRGDADIGAGHRRIGQSHREQRFHLYANCSGRLFDAGQCGIVGHPQAVDDLHLRIAQTQARLDLWPSAVHQHQADAEAVEQRDIVRQAGETAVAQRLAIKGENEGAATMGVDVGRGVAKPFDERIGAGCALFCHWIEFPLICGSSHSINSNSPCLKRCAP